MEFSKEDITQIRIDIESDGESLLSMLIHKDGTLNRQGNGSLPVVKIAAMGVTDGGIFRKLINLLESKLLEHAGVYDQSEKTGRFVIYRIVFLGERPKLRVIEFRVGSEGTEPGVILKYVIGYMQAAIQWTDNWYKKALPSDTQKNSDLRSGGSQKKWWLFGKLVR